MPREPQAPQSFVSKLDKWDNQRLFLLVMGGAQVFVTNGKGETADLASIPAETRIYVPERGSELRRKLEIVEDYVSKHLSGQPGMRIQELTMGTAERTKYSPEFIEGCLRILVARDVLIASVTKQEVRLRLSARGKKQEHARSYAASFAHELVTQSERIGQLVDHGPTKGSYREDLLRELLQRHIPQRFHAATGFISGFDEQLDIIIYDQIEYAPIFRVGNLVVVPPEAVRAVIEVKSSLTPTTLLDALEHLEDFRYAPGFRMPPAFMGVFAFKRNGTSNALAAKIADYYRDDLDKDLGVTGLIMKAYDPIDAVCVLQKDFLTVEYAQIIASNGNKILSPAVVEIENSSGRAFQAAMFFARLMQYLRFPFDGPKNTRNLPSKFGGEVWYKAAHLINGRRPWGMYDPIAIEIAKDHEIDQIATFENELRAYNRWIDGGEWVHPASINSDSFSGDIPNQSHVTDTEPDSGSPLHT